MPKIGSDRFRVVPILVKGNNILYNTPSCRRMMEKLIINYDYSSGLCYINEVLFYLLSPNI